MLPTSDTSESTPYWMFPTDHFLLKDNQKVCLICKERKEEKEFNKHIKTPDGVQPYCRECQKKKREEAKQHPTQRKGARNGHKYCKQCKKQVPLKNFPKNLMASSGYETTCKECKSIRNAARRIERKKAAIEYKGGKCEHCGYSEHIVALQFHHVNSDEKESSWTQLSSKRWPDIIKELDKCIILCANCHAIEHATTYEKVMKQENPA